jgi:anti-sigma factor RsiW
MTHDHDVEQLEALLDGELTDHEAAALRARVASDPALAEALDRLRGERDMRALVWRAMEPRDAQVTAVINSVRAGVRRDQAWNNRLRALRYVSGLAACIMLGFMLGRFLPYGASDGRAGNGIVYEPGRGAMQEVMDTRSAAQQRHNGFKVLLTDNFGRVIAEQRFETFNEAREFTDDLRSAQNRYAAPAQRQPPQQQQPRVSDTIFIKGEF